MSADIMIGLFIKIAMLSLSIASNMPTLQRWSGNVKTYYLAMVASFHTGLSSQASPHIIERNPKVREVW